MPLTAPRFAMNMRLQRAANNAPPLQMGETSDGVSALQQALIDLGYQMPKSTAGGLERPDGIFGSETCDRVKQFQKKYSLTVDGVAGKQTMTKLDDLFRNNDSAWVDPLRDRIELLQEMNGPPGSRPFGATTARKGQGKA